MDALLRAGVPVDMIALALAPFWILAGLAVIAVLAIYVGGIVGVWLSVAAGIFRAQQVRWIYALFLIIYAPLWPLSIGSTWAVARVFD